MRPQPARARFADSLQLARDTQIHRGNAAKRPDLPLAQHRRAANAQSVSARQRHKAAAQHFLRRIGRLLRRALQQLVQHCPRRLYFERNTSAANTGLHRPADAEAELLTEPVRKLTFRRPAYRIRTDSHCLFDFFSHPSFTPGSVYVAPPKIRTEKTPAAQAGTKKSHPLSRVGF